MVFPRSAAHVRNLVIDGGAQYKVRLRHTVGIMHSRTASLVTSAFLCVQFFAATAFASGSGGGFERWYIVEIDGAKAGWARETEAGEDDGRRIASTSELRFKFERMGQAIEVAVSSRFVESAAGDLLEMSSTQTMGTQEVVETFTFIRGIASYEVKHVSESAGGRRERTLPWPEGEWLPPAAARRMIEQQLAADAETITYSTLDPTAGLNVVTLSHTIVNRSATAEAAGKVVPAIEWEVTNSLMPGVRGRDFVDARGVAIRSEMDFGGMKMVMLASEKEAALSEFSPPEMMANTLVKPEGKRIERPREVKRGVYILSLNDGTDMPDLPSVGAQIAERLGPGRVQVEVVRGRTSDALHEDAGAALGRSTMIDPDDESVRALVREQNFPWRSTRDSSHRAGEIETYGRSAAAFVSRYIDDESLGVGFASASEVARTRRGDCTEHAVLLAAMLRAEKQGGGERIPSRVVSGLVLVRGGDGAPVFGYHMWTQGRACDDVKCEWFDLDAAILPDGGTPGVDATHIALSTSTMADGEMVNSMAALIGLLGRLRIEVVEVE